MWKSRYSRAPPAVPIRFLIFAGAASLAMLAVAHAFQAFGHLEPCELCLEQRDGYWLALAVAAAGVGVARLRGQGRRLFAALLAVAFLGEAGVAAYHAGVEWGWWPGPVACTGGHAGVSAADMAAFLKSGPVRMVRCDQAAWRRLGLSMAGWNALAALGLSIASLVAALRRVRR